MTGRSSCSVKKPYTSHCLTEYLASFRPVLFLDGIAADQKSRAENEQHELNDHRIAENFGEMHHKKHHQKEASQKDVLTPFIHDFQVLLVPFMPERQNKVKNNPRTPNTQM
jgi:hypothetical protein